MRGLRGRQNRRQDEETTYWLSYSDMMAGLLLTFVIIISLTVLHANIQYDEKQQELLGKEQQLVIQSEELENERLTVEEQQAVLNAQELKLSQQAEELTAQKAKLIEQAETLNTQSQLLSELQEIMNSQQERLDRIIGVRSELVEALKAEFDDSDLQVAVDEKTGAITMNSSILFSYNEDELKDTGKEFLAKFMQRYARILLSEDYREYVSEILIEGHTDTSGNYLFNLDLSQKRAYSVAEYCMNAENAILDPATRAEMEKVLSTNGKSFSNPVLKADGSVDAAASRRVEIKFRLKDEEMIREMIEILNAEGREDDGIAGANGAAGAAGSGANGSGSVIVATTPGA